MAAPLTSGLVGPSRVKCFTRNGMSGLRLPGGPWGGNRRAKSLVVSVHHAQRPTELALEVNLEALRSALEIAISSEDYTAAAKLRDQIREVEQQDPLIPLKAELEIAIAEERYGDAALLRDQIKELTPPPPEPACTVSSKVTEGVRVAVKSIFVPQQSRPESSSYLFAYKITITNESHPTTIKLVARRWIITDANGRQQEVQGPGVVGEQPELAPGESFSYQSACPLRTATGSMKGTYEMYSRPSDTGPWTTSFLVDIAEFGLDTQGPISF